MKIDLENFPTSESAVRMLESVSTEFYEKSYVGKWLYQVMGVEYDAALKIAEELPLQFFPETATWGLRYHEEKWQLPVRENLSYEERRKLIYEKMHFKAPMTPYKMEQYIEKVTGGVEIRVLDCHDSGEYAFHPTHPNVFKVICISKDTEDTLDIKKIRKTVDKIKQSHTMYTIAYVLVIIFDSRMLERIRLQNLNIRFASPFPIGMFADESKDVKIIFKNIRMGHKERLGNIGIISKRNAWYLDGEYLLNGERLLNSEVIKETIEEV